MRLEINMKKHDTLFVLVGYDMIHDILTLAPGQSSASKFSWICVTWQAIDRIPSWSSVKDGSDELRPCSSGLGWSVPSQKFGDGNCNLDRFRRVCAVCHGILTL